MEDRGWIGVDGSRWRWGEIWAAEKLVWTMVPVKIGNAESAGRDGRAHFITNLRTRSSENW